MQTLPSYRTTTPPTLRATASPCSITETASDRRSASLASSEPYDGSSSATELGSGAFAAFVPVSVIAEPLAAPPLEREPCRRRPIDLESVKMAHDDDFELVRREPLGERLEARQQPRGYRGVAHDQEQRFDREAHVGRDPDRVQRWASGAHARTDEVSRQESMGRHGHGDGAGARRGRVLTVTIADDAITSASVMRHVLPSV